MRKTEWNKLPGIMALLVVLHGAVYLAATAEAVDVQGDETAPVKGNMGLAFNSKYIWRGQNLVDGPVLQPEGSLSYKGFSGTVWANYDADEGDEWSELDYTLDYTASLGSAKPELEVLSFSVGYTYYTFPNLDEDKDSHEVYVGGALDILLSPSVTVYYDFDQGDGVYYELGLGHGFSLAGAELQLAGSVGYNDGQWGYDSSFSAGVLSVGLDVPLTSRLALGASAAASLALDEQYDDEFFFGTSIIFNF